MVLSGWMRAHRGDLVVGSALLVAAVTGSLILGPDSNWDLFNYHAFNGRALLDRRLGRDVAPNGITSYLNPLFDLPAAVLLRGPGYEVPFMLGLALIQFACWLAVYRLARTLFDTAPSRVDLRVTVATVVAITGWGPRPSPSRRSTTGWSSRSCVSRFGR